MMEQMLIKRLTILFPCMTALILLGCAHMTSSSPAVPWMPPKSESPKTYGMGPLIPVEQVREKFTALTIADAVDIALLNNPDTQEAWANAKAVAAGYRSAQGAWLPTINTSGALAKSKNVYSQYSSGSVGGQSDTPVTTYGAEVNLSYLLFNFGGRSAVIEESRQALLAADWTHNAVIQNTVLQTEAAFFNHVEAKAMLEADRASLADAEANLKAAEERHRVGLATSADILQAKTACSEVKLAVQGAEGQNRTTRGALALSMGYAANLPYDFNSIVPEIPEGELSETVDQLIDQAMTNRPDLQAVRAYANAAAENVRLARSKMLPSLSAAGSVGRSWLKGVTGFNDSYSGALLLQIPVFGGLSRQFDLARSKAEAEAAQERTRGFEQTVTFQVFSAHSDFLTAIERVKTTDDLLASATQSEEVALGRYKQGVGSILDLLSAQRALALARAERINARLGWFTALAQLAHDVGILGLHGDNPLMPGSLPSR
jgi:outer membrane protein